jgi:hypothetical protein
MICYASIGPVEVPREVLIMFILTNRLQITKTMDYLFIKRREQEQSQSCRQTSSAVHVRYVGGHINVSIAISLFDDVAQDQLAL